MAEYLVIDIETIARENIDLTEKKMEIYEEVSQEYKKQETIEAHTQKNFEKYCKTLSLDKATNQIISISLMHRSFDEPLVIFSNNERDLLTQFVAFLDSFYKKIRFNFAGYNINGFDIPNLVYKIAKYGLTVNYPAFTFEKYDNLDILDLFGGKGKLKDVLADFGIEGKYGGIDGSMIQDLWNDHQYDIIKQYSKQDAKIEHDLLLRVLDVYGVGV
jgi:predicted PolB exonuclease-like 3'-5' exonuclease